MLLIDHLFFLQSMKNECFQINIVSLTKEKRKCYLSFLQLILVIQLILDQLNLYLLVFLSPILEIMPFLTPNFKSLLAVAVEISLKLNK